MSEEASVKVAVRVRPLSAKEQLQNMNECISYLPQPAEGIPSILLDSTRQYSFDFIFAPYASQGQVYDSSVKPIVEKFVEGYHATVLAYGQTGSGKTFTMGTGLEYANAESEAGIIPRAIEDIFTCTAEKECDISVSFLELYNEELRDLLSQAKVSIREVNGQIVWVGVSAHHVMNTSDVMDLLHKGSLGRSTGSTDMNSTSSRSHAIFTINLKMEGKFSKFHFVDLAGSERLKKTKSTGDRAKEGISINSGLLAMGKVIHALNEGSSHVPYRDSKLTRLLQDSLGGNSQTLMIACVSPADGNFGETMNTLNYASRARNIKNKVVVNEDMGQMEVHQLRNEISRLRSELMQYKRIGIAGNGDLKDRLMKAEMERDSLLLQLGATSGTVELNPVVVEYKQRIEQLERDLEFHKLKPVTIPTGAGDNIISTISKAKEEIQKELDLIKNTDEEDNLLNLIDQLNQDISVKEELVIQLESTQTEFNEMKTRYEMKLKQMQETLMVTEKERDEVIRKMPQPQDGGEVRGRFEDKIRKMKQEMQDLKAKYEKALQDKQRKQKENEQILVRMKTSLEQMKKDKLELIKKMKALDQKQIKENQEKQRQLELLMRVKRRNELENKKLKESNRMNSLMLRRRTEESQQAQSKLKSVLHLLKMKNVSSIRKIESPPRSPIQRLFRRKVVDSRPSTSTTMASIDLDEKTREINELIQKIVVSKSMLDIQQNLVEKRNALANEKLELLNSPDDDDNDRLQTLEAELVYYSARIKAVQLDLDTSVISEAFDQLLELLASIDEKQRLVEILVQDLINSQLSIKQQEIRIQELEQRSRDLEEKNKIMSMMQQKQKQLEMSEDHEQQHHHGGEHGSGDVFERLHREQTIASQAKVKDASHETLASEKALEKLSQLRQNIKRNFPSVASE